MDNVVKFERPDLPADIEALRAMVHAVRSSMEIGFDRDKFLSSAANVWDGVIASDLADEVD
jgi:hypothetical protein